MGFWEQPWQAGGSLWPFARYPFRRRERWAWNGLLVGLLVWFLVDTLITLKYQVYFNVIFNVGLLVLILVPLVLTRKDMT